MPIARSKDIVVYLDHILEWIGHLELHLKNIKKSKFFKSLTIQDAAVRSLEIIGEASKKIPESIKKEYSVVPWRKIAGMRDKLVHDYFEVELDLAWEVAKKDVPVLKKQIIKIKKELLSKQLKLKA